MNPPPILASTVIQSNYEQPFANAPPGKHPRDHDIEHEAMRDTAEALALTTREEFIQ